MPLIDERMNPIGVKQYAENRHAYEASRRELKNPNRKGN